MELLKKCQWPCRILIQEPAVEKHSARIPLKVVPEFNSTEWQKRLASAQFPLLLFRRCSHSVNYPRQSFSSKMKSLIFKFPYNPLWHAYLVEAERWEKWEMMWQLPKEDVFIRCRLSEYWALWTVAPRWWVWESAVQKENVPKGSPETPKSQRPLRAELWWRTINNMAPHLSFGDIKTQIINSLTQISL